MQNSDGHNILDIIDKKKKGESLDHDEIEYSIMGYVRGEIPDYQMSALLMAIWFRGLDSRETVDLTQIMARSGDEIDLSGVAGNKVDKHSTGGVGDSTTLVVAPLVAACGGVVAKMSGRGLGHTGGTLDKLESIPGLSINQSIEKFTEILSRCGLSVIGQTGRIVPADKMLYALRDVTGTINNSSLIAASVMSKKIAAGADAVVLDVKTGNGAFMESLEEARTLAESMVDIGRRSGRSTVALITDMSQPLGSAVGNALEIREVLDILRGEDDGHGTPALLQVSLALASWMLVLAGISVDVDDARERLEAALHGGEGLSMLRCMIEAQGGRGQIVEDPGLLPQARFTSSLEANESGYVTAIDARAVGASASHLGAGRKKKDDVVDPAVGIWMKKRIGDPVTSGEALATIHSNDKVLENEAAKILKAAITIGENIPEPPPLIYDTVVDLESRSNVKVE